MAPDIEQISPSRRLFANFAQDTLVCLALSPPAHRQVPHHLGKRRSLWLIAHNITEHAFCKSPDRTLRHGALSVAWLWLWRYVSRSPNASVRARASNSLYRHVGQAVSIVGESHAAVVYAFQEQDRDGKKQGTTTKRQRVSSLDDVPSKFERLQNKARTPCK